MRIKGLDIGVESVTRWQVEDEVHLPTEGPAAPSFLPEYRALDSILSRPSLDERLPDLLQPTGLDPDLLEPSALTDLRAELQGLFSRRVATPGLSPDDRALFSGAADLLGADSAMDDEVRAALAMLLRG